MKISRVMISKSLLSEVVFGFGLCIRLWRDDVTMGIACLLFFLKKAGKGVIRYEEI